jgi:hypothetical protein
MHEQACQLARNCADSAKIVQQIRFASARLGEYDEHPALVQQLVVPDKLLTTMQLSMNIESRHLRTIERKAVAGHKFCSSCVIMLVTDD